jgi:hypothetical protein
MPELDAVFARLREMLQRHGEGLELARDEPGDFVLLVRDARDDGYRPWFGAVKTGKRYVSYHLMPVYAHPELLDSASDTLRRRMQGKSCFNFTAVDEGLLAELDDLTRRGRESFGG